MQRHRPSPRLVCCRPRAALRLKLGIPPAPACLQLAALLIAATIPGAVATQAPAAPSSELRDDNRGASSELDAFVVEEAAAELARIPVPDGIAEVDCCCQPGLFDQFELFASCNAFEAPPQIQLNGNFGICTGFHWGLPLWADKGVGLQLSTSLGAINARNGTAVLVDDYLRMESFTTLGLFRRAAIDAGERVSWGLVYDWFFEEYASLEYAQIDYGIGQWRGQVGYWFNPCDQVGVWATAPGSGDTAEIAPWLAGVVMAEREGFAQGAVFWEHAYASGMNGRIWIGVAESPGSLIYGGDVFYPFHPCLALTVEINYVLASTTPKVTPALENWSMAFGIAWNPRGDYCGDDRFRPLLPLANPGTFVFRERE